MYRILLVEDDAALADAITQVLTAWGHEVQKVRDFRHVTEEFAEWKPQIVLMDLMLPFFNGHHWTQELRRITSVPIVYLSSASDNLNIVMAMNMGGDDFIAKPVDPAVLAAKVNAVLRRAYDMPATGNILACGEAVLDLDSAALSIHGQSIPLTRNELIILRTLMEQRGRIVSRETLMTRLWQMDEYVEENTLTVNVNRLRKKLSAAGRNPPDWGCTSSIRPPKCSIAVCRCPPALGRARASPLICIRRNWGRSEVLSCRFCPLFARFSPAF